MQHRILLAVDLEKGTLCRPLLPSGGGCLCLKEYLSEVFVKFHASFVCLMAQIGLGDAVLNKGVIVFSTTRRKKKEDEKR